VDLCQSGEFGCALRYEPCKRSSGSNDAGVMVAPSRSAGSSATE
jgi:hypothetical protein